MVVDIYKTNKKYSIIYADPPWQFKVWSKNGSGRSAENHYQTMNKYDIQNLPIPRICDKNCALFLWITFPCLYGCLELIEKWGFKYKTVAFTWIKLNKKSDSLFWGLGYYTRANAELCILATKGKPLKRVNKNVHQVIISHIREHSRKPDEARERIADLFGDVARIELFARQKFKGWDCWGNEV